MSQQARQALVTSPHIVFQRGSQRSDLLDESLTQTTLIALLQEMVDAGFHMELTAVRTDHGNDAYLGLHSHANGYGVDLWPLVDATPGNYVDASTEAFQTFLKTLAASKWMYQIGLAGSAKTPANFAAAGPTAFDDDDEDHVHCGSI